MNPAKTIYVYLDHLSGAAGPALLGLLTPMFSRGKELFSFAFDKDWLQRHPTQILDPDLQFYAGPQFAPKSTFGLFMDSAPDRWGRQLMLRREAYRARQNASSPQILHESDFLLGVYDHTRMGALRFKTDPAGNFLNDDGAMSAPPWARLRELEEACRHLENEEDGDQHEQWLAMLIAPGSSLGGARPKASVTDPQDNLWIAKFPRHQDNANMSAWEYVTSQMARDAGICVPQTRIENYSRFGATFLAKRFDRMGTQRIHFASAMTLLGKTEGADAHSGSSYLELAQFIVQYGAKPQEDLRELWTRIVFAIAVANTDDHLRNHGFLLTQSGWALSPAYDLNPNPQGNGLTLNISDTDNSLDFSLAMAVAPLFRVKADDAKDIMKTVCNVVSSWRHYASRAGISSSEQDAMQTAFRTK